MNKIVLFLFGMFISTTFFSNIRAIDFGKINFKEAIEDELNFILENDYMFSHWSPEWQYDVSLEDCLTKLKKVSKVCKKKADSYDEYLLKGIIAHYMYNLNVEDQYEVAFNAYHDAQIINASDYRGYWFLGSHFAHSALPDSSVIYLLKAENINQEISNPDYWQDSALAYYMANMPSHCIFSMEKASSLLGETCYFESTLGSIVRDRLPLPNINDKYEIEELWTSQEGQKQVTFISRMLGVKFSMDTTWLIQFGEYQNQMSYVLITPDPEYNDSGKEITYSIMIMFHVPDENEEIEDYANIFIDKYDDRKVTGSYDSLNPDLAFEFEDPLLYPDIGGGHIQFMAISSQEPISPGKSLEKPSIIPSSEEGELQYYRFNDSYTRFEGELMYIIMLDTCNDIYEESLEVYDEFLKGLVIE